MSIAEPPPAKAPAAEDPADRGWGWPALSKKAHYFIGGRSLCGSWMYFGKTDNPEDKGGNHNDCAQCVKKRAKL